MTHHDSPDYNRDSPGTQFFTDSLEFGVLTQHLSFGARATLTGLLSFRNRKTGRCNPRLETLARRIGSSLRTVERYVAELKRSGLVTSTKHQKGSSYEFVIQATTPGAVENFPADVGDNSSACGKVPRKPVRPATVGGTGISRPATVGGARPATVGGADAPYPYMNPRIEPVSKPADAAVGCTVVGLWKSAPEAAAAANPATPVKTGNGDRNGTEAQETVGDVMSPGPSIPRLAEGLAHEFSTRHPQPGMPHKAAVEILRVLTEGWTPAELRERHREWCEYWASLPAGRFIPMLWRWFRDGEFEAAPVWKASWEQRRRAYCEAQARER